MASLSSGYGIGESLTDFVQDVVILLVDCHSSIIPARERLPSVITDFRWSPGNRRREGEGILVKKTSGACVRIASIN